MANRFITFISTLGLYSSLFLSSAQTQAGEDNDLAALKCLSLEDLLNVEVTIAGKQPQKIADIPAAVYVVTQQDIRRIGATSIPEALRIVPGMQVARIDGNKWAIAIRGFNNLFSNNLLVMIDGRTVYTPLFSGTHWDVQDTMIEDIERIEVIRGPGASVWGANAVNGVINIISKNTKDTQGTLLSGTLGSERGIISARHGNRLSDDTTYRLYAKYRNQDNSISKDDSKATDGWDDARGGFRVNWQVNSESQVTVQGDFYQGDMGEKVKMFTLSSPDSITPLDRTSEVWGANLLTRWTKNLSDGSRHELQVYYDHTYRNSWIAKIERGTADVDYQYQFSPWDGHDIVIGAGYRYIFDDIPHNSLTETKVVFTPEKNQDHLFSVFLQDDISIIENTLWLTLGSKFEHNDYTGFEIQPNAKIRWKPADGHLVWASVSRAVRTPSRIEHDASPLLGELVQPNVISTFIGNEAYGSEQLIAYEIGYRVQPHEKLALDFAIFYNDYDHVRSFTPVGLSSSSQTAPLAAYNLEFENQLTSENYGFEVTADWHPIEEWTLRASYTFLDMQVHSPSFSASQALELARHLRYILSLDIHVQRLTPLRRLN